MGYTYYNMNTPLPNKRACSLIRKCTGNFFSEALILASVDPQYDKRLFIWFLTRNIHVFFLYWSWESMKNLWSYCGLTNSRMSASEKDLPVLQQPQYFLRWLREITNLMKDYALHCHIKYARSARWNWH